MVPSFLNENHYHVYIIRKGITHTSFYHANRDPNPCFGHTLYGFSRLNMVQCNLNQTSSEDNIMSDLKPNYTVEMVSIMAANQPLNLAKAKALAIQFDKGVRSVIAKISKEGFVYESLPARAKKKSAPTKLDMVQAIATALDSDDLSGLEKATGQALSNLLMAIR